MKKKINIFLLLFVLAIWGTAGYRYLSSYFQQQKIAVSAQAKIPEGIKMHEKDTFELQSLRRDPFLNANLEVTSKQKPIKYAGTVNKISKKNIPVPASLFPEIDYFGYIKSSQQQKELVLLKVNNQLLKLRIGQSSQGLKVVKIYRDSVQIAFGRELRFFKKKG